MPTKMEDIERADEQVKDALNQEREADKKKAEANKKKAETKASLKARLTKLDEQRHQMLSDLEKLGDTKATPETVLQQLLNQQLLNSEQVRNLMAVLPLVAASAPAASAPAASAPAASAPAASAPAASAPAPTLSSVAPSTITAGSGDTTLTLSGANFQNGQTLLWNGTPATTNTVASSDQKTLQAPVPASFLTTVGTYQVAVYDPNTNTTSTPITVTLAADPLTTEAEGVIHKYSLYAAAAGLLPGTIIDFAGTFVFQYLMIGELAKVYQQDWSNEKTATAITGLIGGGVGVGLGQVAKALFQTVVPFSTPFFSIGVITDPTSAYLSTQTIGRYFMRQFQGAAAAKQVQSLTGNLSQLATQTRATMNQLPQIVQTAVAKALVPLATKAA